MKNRRDEINVENLLNDPGAEFEPELFDADAIWHSVSSGRGQVSENNHLFNEKIQK